MSNSSRIFNGSFQQPTLKPWYLNEYNVSMVVLYVLVITAAIVGNILICAAVCINKKLRNTVSSYFIVSLAFSDLCTASFSMIFDLETFVTYGKWTHGDVFCFVWGTVYLITVPISMWNLFVLSIDRYKILKNPWDRFKASPFMTPRRALIVIAVLWVYCLTFSLIPPMGWNYKPPERIAHFCSFNVSPSYAILSAFLNFYLPMFAMCVIYYKIYQIARTQYLMPTGLKFNSLPSRTAGNDSLREEPREHQNMNTGTQQNYESCNDVRDSTKNAVGSGLSNLGLEMENNDNTANRTRTLIENIENTDNDMQQVNEDQKAIGLEADINDETNTRRLEDVTLCKKEEEEVEDGEKITEDTAQKEDHSTNELNPYHLRDSANGSVSKQEEKDNSSLYDIQDNQDSSLSNQAVMSQQDVKEKDDGRSLDFVNEEVQQEIDNAILDDEPPEKRSSTSEQHDQEEGVCSSLEQQEVGSPGGLNNNPSQVTHPGVSLEMQTYLKNKVLKDEDRGKSSSRESLQSICTLQSTLPDGRHSVLIRGRHDDLSTSRDTLNSAFGSMDDVTKRRKIFVKNKKAARTISIIVSAFLLCWIPYNTFSVVLNFCQDKCYKLFLFHVLQVLLFFGYLNSVLNPIILSYQNVQFRISYRKMLRTIFPCLRNIVN